MVERFGDGCGGGVEFDALVVERIDKRDEAFGLVAVVGFDDGNIVDEHCRVGFRNRDEIQIAERRFA